MSTYLRVLEAPVVTEKVSLLSAGGEGCRSCYAVYVSKKASKGQIKSCIEDFFGVKVARIGTLMLRGKSKRFKGVMGKRKDRKKVYFSLPAGQVIDMVKV